MYTQTDSIPDEENYDAQKILTFDGIVILDQLALMFHIYSTYIYIYTGYLHYDISS